MRRSSKLKDQIREQLNSQEFILARSAVKNRMVERNKNCKKWKRGETTVTREWERTTRTELIPNEINFSRSGLPLVK